MRLNERIIKILLLTVLLSLSSCSLYRSASESTDLKSDQKENSTCSPKGEKLRLYTDNSPLKNNFLEYLSENNYSFAEAFIFWNLLQLSARPDATTIDSRILSYIKYKGEGHFLVILPQDLKQNTYFKYLEFLRKTTQLKKPLTRTMRDFYRSYKNPIPISLDTQKFIEKNKSAFYRDIVLRAKTFKGNQLIKTGESISPINYHELYREALKLKVNNISTNQLFSNSRGFNCSFDHRLYNGQNPLVERVSSNVNSNFFGMFYNQDNYFLTLTSSSPTMEKVSKNNISFYSTKIEQFNAAFCINTDEDQLIISKNLEHSEQLLNNIIFQSENNTVNELINNKRFINLKYPQRSILEVYGKQQSIKTQGSIYYVPTLGEIDIIDIKNKILIYRDPRTNQSRDQKLCN